MDEAIAPPAARSKPQRSLGPRLVLLVIAVNAVLSILATTAQLYLSYDRGRTKVLDTISVTEQEFRRSFETALWEFDFELIEVLLDGVDSNPDVAYLALETSDGRRWVRGATNEAVSVVEQLALTHRDNMGREVSVGDLRIGLTFAHVQDQVVAQLWTVLASNLAKTVLASLALFFLFQNRVVRHLNAISEHVSSVSWLDVDRALRLDRPKDREPDDIDQIVTAINAAKRRSLDDYQALRVETAQRRAAEAELRQKAERLEAANREQADFTYAISHDLKSPSNTIRMLLDEIRLGDEDVLSADTLELLQSAQQTNDRMARLIDDLLAYARTVGDAVRLEELDLRVMMREITEDMRADITRFGAVVRFDGAPKVMGNEAQIRVLMQNLLANGLKFSHPQRPPVIDVVGDVDPSDRMATVRVSDNGIGIEPEHRERIFGMFKRLHTHDTIEGSGLGLAICERVALNHEGSIRVEPNAPHGSTFVVKLPG